MTISEIIHDDSKSMAENFSSPRTTNNPKDSTRALIDFLDLRAGTGTAA